MNINALHESRIFVHLEDIFFKDTSGLLDNIQINEKEVNQQHDVLTNQFLPIIHFLKKMGECLIWIVMILMKNCWRLLWSISNNHQRKSHIWHP